MSIAVIAKNKNSYPVKRFVEEARKRDQEIHILLWDNLVFTNEDIQDISNKKSLSQFSIIIPLSPVDTTPQGYKKERRSLLLLLAHFCEQHGITMLNRDFYQKYQHFNKLNQQFYLSWYDFPAIPSIHAPTENFSELSLSLRIPFIAKYVDGSLGRDIIKITSKEEFEAFKEKRTADGRLFIFQKYYPIEKDYRVFYFQGKILGIFERYNSEKEWRTNVASRAPRIAIEDRELEALSINVGNKFSFDLVGIDILKDQEGGIKIIELNTIAQFKVLERVVSKNIAGTILEGLLGQVNPSQS